MRTRINEDFFDDNRIEDAAPEEPDYGGTGGTDLFAETIKFYGDNVETIIKILKRKLYFIRNNNAFHNTTIDKITLRIAVHRNNAGYYRQTVPNSISGIKVDAVWDNGQQERRHHYIW